MGTLNFTAIGRDRRYWDQLLSEDYLLDDQAEWLAYSREIYAVWTLQYLRPGRRVLKTDAFEEIRGPEVAQALGERFEQVVITDLAYAALRSGSRTTPANWVQTPVQGLPFATGSFDAVASFSTLDHFRTQEEISASLAELARLTRPGGQMLITLDNPANPVVALRNALPHKLLAGSGVAPYEYGKTLRPAQFHAALESSGWSVKTFHGALHAPRALAVAASSICGEGKRIGAKLFRACLRPFELLQHLPSNRLTGYFMLAVCERS